MFDLRRGCRDCMQQWLNYRAPRIWELPGLLLLIVPRQCPHCGRRQRKWLPLVALGMMMEVLDGR